MAWLVLPSLLLFSVNGNASELLRVDFRSVPQGKEYHVAPGKDAGETGWTYPETAGTYVDNPPILSYPVSVSNARRGAISFDLQRKHVVVPDSRTVFALKDADGNNLLLFQVDWEGRGESARPAFHLRGHEFYHRGIGLWSPWVQFDRDVRPGQWIHVDLAWDDDNGRYKLYVDGTSLDVSLKAFDGRRVGPDPRNARNRELGQLVYEAKPFGHILGMARNIQLGVNVLPGRENGKGTSSLSNSVLANFVVHVDQWPSGLGRSAISSVTDDTFKVPGISGKLVAGDTVTATLVAAPEGKASFDMGKVKGIAMEEVRATEGAPGVPPVAPGTYRGSYTIRPGDDHEDGQIVGRFASPDNVAADPVPSASKWTIDTKPAVTFQIDRKDLPADSSSKARIKLKAVDANGKPVQGRHLKLTLATTDEYTGLVGAGDFGKNVGASVETRWRGETDAWGEVEFDYLAGFAAKTVILTAKDLDSGGVTADYITAFKEASIDIALTPPISRAAARRGIQYTLKVEASRTELTADGKSRSVIRATLLDPNGSTVAGDPVAFTLSGDNGKLRTIQGTTDPSGTATAEYVAGKKIGIVVITATATLRNAQGNVSITLLSDAPAKILLMARPDSLPADGFSRADISVKVTDINDNPNSDTTVEFRIAKGGGKLDTGDRVTDRFGDAANRYTAGNVPGIATIVATVRSKVPSEEELAKARNVLFVPHSPDGDEIRVERWLKKKGDSFMKGDPLVEYTVGRSPAVCQITAPFDGTMGDQFIEYWDEAEVGQTLGILHPSP